MLYANKSLLLMVVLIIGDITRRSGVFFKLVSDSDTRFKNICLELLVIGFSIAGGSGQFY